MAVMKQLTIKKAVFSLLVVSILSGCVSEEQRLARCEAKGVSRDVCYQVEQSNQQMIINNAEQNAYVNAREAVKQHAQAAKKKNIARQGNKKNLLFLSIIHLKHFTKVNSLANFGRFKTFSQMRLYRVKHSAARSFRAKMATIFTAFFEVIVFFL